MTTPRIILQRANGTMLYVSTTQGVRGFALEPGTRLTPLPGSPFPGLSRPDAMAH